jgi:predicted helicase
LYRPFDIRKYFQHQELVDRPKQEVMNNMIDDNLGLITTRQVAESIFNHAIATNHVIDNRVTVSNKGSAYLFPLYFYPNDQLTLFGEMQIKRRPNLATEFINKLSAKLELEFISDGKGDEKKTFAPEDIFNYIYAVFHSPQYRQRYAEFLKIDFPRVPLTSNKELFWELVKKGDRLVQLHLMKATGKAISSYPVAGSNLVEQVKYHENKQQIWINSDQYFAGIPPQIWNFYIGGYQVCQKWLKDRKGRHLSYDDLEHYQQIISILGESIALMETIDIIINKYGGFPFS